MGSLSSSRSWRIKRPACGERRASSESKLSRCHEERAGMGSGNSNTKAGFSRSVYTQDTLQVTF